MITSRVQSPIGSGFGAASTTADVMQGIDLNGKAAVVTGGYSGLGRETVRSFISAGAQVVVPARDLDRAREALADVEGTEIWPMDLMDPESIRQFAHRFLGAYPQLHLLVNSAGIMANPLARDARGYESQFSTNHLGHFQLTAEVWPGLRNAGGARVIAVSSMGHRYSAVDFDDPNYEHRAYHPFQAYGQSKTANILFALGLDERGKQHGVRAFSLHPGSIPGTGLEKHVPREDLVAAGIIDADGNPILDPRRQLKTVPQGAATTVWCATSPRLEGLGGLYCENCDVAPLMIPPSGETGMADSTRLRGVMPYAVDPGSADRLWSLSEALIGMRVAA